MRVSIIVPTMNEERNITDCLRSVKDQDFSGQMEIILVDNGSWDRTKEIAAKYTDLVYNFGTERSAQRNFGAKKSKGDWLLFLDADMRLSNGVIEECVEKVKESKNIIIGLHVPEKIIGKGYFAKIRNFERSFYDATAIDAPRFISKMAFEKIGGFDENLYACEDWDLAKRLKKEGNFGIITSPLFHNEKAVTLKKYLQKKKYYGKNFDKYFQKWGKNDPDIKKQFGFYYRFLGVFLENGKWKRFISRPDLAIGVWLLKFMVGLNYLFSRKR